ncbi:hypothetical protein LAZ67_1006263 [Cordylochernes scorpioides]|uniref:Ig-like domain-containing protein n=1 Tax=Cordylochernes scorpioides TaxID=51811 RepID=A0ABY6JYU8_9ARAC|nr:hypothetical protein LAZ67_1006263 [Cordylochernes scorpioides]
MPGHRKRRQFKQTDAFTRGMVIGLKRAGWSIRQIAADTHLGASTVHRLWRRWLEQGNVAIYRNAGATRVTSARVDRRILRQAVAAPQATCTAILQHVQDTLDHSISTRTISRRLVANGLHSCRPLRRLPLTPPNRRQRLEWCRLRSTWMTEWHRRRRGERSNPEAIVERPTVRQRGIMVWGAIAYDSRSPLLRIQGTMTAQRYVDDVLRPVTLPYLQGVPNALYQQDNTRPHTARISQQALQDIQMLPWPPYSPDLSPIEHVWDIIGRRLHALPQPRSEDELWQMVEREWRAIPQDAIRTLIDSLPRRVAACIAVREDRPELRHTFPRQVADAGGRVALRCVAAGNPLPRVTWTLDGGPLPGDTGPRRHYGDFVNRRGEVVSFVNISGLLPEDGGVYACEARSEAGVAIHEARVDVRGPPHVRDMPNITVVAGETLVYRCPVSGYPEPKVTWLRGDQELPLTERHSVSNSTLRISPVSRENDQGTYVCRATMGTQSVSKSLHLRVLKKPVLSPLVIPKGLAEGMRVLVTCSVLTGDPPVTVRWMKDNQPLNGLPDVEESALGDMGSSLAFGRVGSAHNGNYSCVAENMAGRALVWGTMTVNDFGHELSTPPHVWFVMEVLMNHTSDGSLINLQLSGELPQRIYVVLIDSILDMAYECRPPCYPSDVLHHRPDLQSRIFPVDLEDHVITISSKAKHAIYVSFVYCEMHGITGNPLAIFHQALRR